MVPKAVVMYPVTSHSSTRLFPNMMLVRCKLTDPVDLIAAALRPDSCCVILLLLHVLQLSELRAFSETSTESRRLRAGLWSVPR